MEMQKQQPNDCFLMFAIAQEHVNLGNDTAAQKGFEYLVANFATYLPTYYQLGMLYERTNQNAKATEAYTKGIAVAKAANDDKTARELNEALNLID